MFLRGDLFLSNEEHTRFPSILWEVGVTFPRLSELEGCQLQAGEAAGWPGAGVTCLRERRWDWRCLGVLPDPGLSKTLREKMEEAGWARGSVSACVGGVSAPGRGGNY